MELELPVFRAYRGTEPPRFASPAELECAKVLDYYDVAWEYEPRTFVLELLYRTSQVIRPVREPIEQRDEPVGDRDDVRGRLVVQVEELALLRGQRQARHGRRLSITAASA